MSKIYICTYPNSFLAQINVTNYITTEGYRRRRDAVDDLNAEFDALMAEINEDDDHSFTGTDEMLDQISNCFLIPVSIKINFKFQLK